MKMYKALYREYRPEVFEEMLGQEHIVKILSNQIERDTVNHAYLFCGTRGTGKTTTARLLAKAVNCLDETHKPCGKCANCVSIKEGTFMDLIEIDAASNNGIDDIRELRESVNFPAVIGRKKVYIIDEVHMLSKGAFNGFLKTLEEPPENVMFILATTEPQKLPQTILSRCIRMDFRRVSEQKLIERMEQICTDRNISVDPDALRLVAANADGSVRDGLTLLDQCISGRNERVTREEVLEALGAVGDETYIEIVNAIIRKNVYECIAILDRIFAAGKDARQVLMGLMNHYRNLMLTKYVKNPEDMLNMSLENIERVREQSETLDLADINDAIIELSHTSSDIDHTTQPRILLELVVVKLASGLMGRAPMQVAHTQCHVEIPQQPQQSASSGQAQTAGQSQTKAQSVSRPAVSMEFKEDMDRLWVSICQEAENRRPELRTFISNTEVVSVSDGEIVVKASNQTAVMMLDRYKGLLGEISESLSGSRKNIVVIDNKGNESVVSDVNETASTVSELLGVDVKII